MLKPVVVGCVALAAVLCTGAAVKKKHVYGYGGLVGHDGHVDGGPTAVRIDAEAGRAWGQILMAGEEHGGHSEMPMGGPSVYPELHVSSNRIESVSIKGSDATIIARGQYVSGMNEGPAMDVRIEVLVQDDWGPNGEDHVKLWCYDHMGNEVFHRHGLLTVGEIRVGNGNPNPGKPIRGGKN